MIPERPDYITGLQQCSSCEGETALPLTDGECASCLLYRKPALPPPTYGLSFYRDDGTYDWTQLFRSRDKAQLALKFWSEIDPRRVKFETFPPAGGNEPGYSFRAVRPEPAVPEVAAGALPTEVA